jgi:hypothetical protein
MAFSTNSTGLLAEHLCETIRGQTGGGLATPL